jgi:hypothetical protein
MSIQSGETHGSGEQVPRSLESLGPEGSNTGLGRGRGGGPKTRAGKAKSAQNSVRHAITSPSPSAGGESQDEREAFHDGFRSAFKPMDTVQDELVHNLASDKWHIRRVLRAEVAAINISYDAVDERLLAESPGGKESSVETELSKRGLTLGGCCGLLDSLGSIAGSAELADPQWRGVLVLLGLTGKPLSTDVEQMVPSTLDSRVASGLPPARRRGPRDEL